MEKEIIHIKPIDLRDQKPTGEGDIQIELSEKYIIYYAKFYAEEPINKQDHDLGWETVYNHFETVVSKSAIVGMEKSYMPTQNLWAVYVFVYGMSEDLKMFFKKESEAQDVFDKLFKYFYD